MINGSLRINIGSGPDFHPAPNYEGWTGVDRRGAELGANCVAWEAPNPLPFDDGSVDAAMSEHFLEHLEHADALIVLSEVHRVLKPSSLFCLALPDCYHPRKRRCLETGIDEDCDRHKSVWTCDLLAFGLLLAGFAEISFRQWWDFNGHFHERPIYGVPIKRTPDNDPRNQEGREYGRLWSTSLVVVASKADDERITEAP